MSSSMIKDISEMSKSSPHENDKDQCQVDSEVNGQDQNSPNPDANGHAKDQSSTDADNNENQTHAPSDSDTKDQEQRQCSPGADVNDEDQNQTSSDSDMKNQEKDESSSDADTNDESATKDSDMNGQKKDDSSSNADTNDKNATEPNVSSADAKAQGNESEEIINESDDSGPLALQVCVTAEVRKRKAKHLEWMECPVCLEIPRYGPLFCCKKGHIMCKDCKPKVRECPTCRDKCIDCRNVIAEKLLQDALEDYELKCRYSIHGCARKDLLSTIEDHESLDCKYRTTECPDDKCNWRGPLTELTEHGMENRCFEEKVLMSNSWFEFVIREPESEQEILFTANSYCYWGPFLLITQEPLKDYCVAYVRRNGSGHWYTYVKSLTHIQSKMRVEVRIQKEGNPRQLFTYTGHVSSSEDTKQVILKKGNFLMLRDSQLKTLVVGATLMTLRIRVFQE